MSSPLEPRAIADATLRSPDELRAELGAYLDEFRSATRSVIQAHGEHSLIAHQAEWHFRGIGHHMSRMLDAYVAFARGVSARAAIVEALDVLVMYAPDLQHVLFEFYALVNLSRISLDNLRLFLRPVFKTEFGQLPKSVMDFLEDSTDCPVYVDLAKQETLTYLVDVRNCLVHFRTFATSDNAVVVGDHVSKDDEERILGSHGWFDHMARARFRRTDRGISVNVFLPDKVFDHSGATEKLVKFTYDARLNILSQAMEFTRLARHALLSAFELLIEPGNPSYQYAKKRKVR
jgi:hypothetical protein